MRKYGNVYNINKRQTISSNTGVKLILNQYCWHCNNYNGDDVEIGEIVPVPEDVVNLMLIKHCQHYDVKVIDSMKKKNRHAKTISLISSSLLYRGMQIRWNISIIYQFCSISNQNYKNNNYVISISCKLCQHYNNGNIDRNIGTGNKCVQEKYLSVSTYNTNDDTDSPIRQKKKIAQK